MTARPDRFQIELDNANGFQVVDLQTGQHSYHGRNLVRAQVELDRRQASGRGLSRAPVMIGTVLFGGILVAMLVGLVGLGGYLGVLWLGLVGVSPAPAAIPGAVIVIAALATAVGYELRQPRSYARYQIDPSTVPAHVVIRNA